MLIISVLFFAISVYIGYYRSKNIFISQISPIHTPACWIPGNRHPWQWITLFLQFIAILICLTLVYSMLEDKFSNIFISLSVLLVIFTLRFILSALFGRMYVMKNHKKSAEYFLRMKKMDNMFKGE